MKRRNVLVIACSAERVDQQIVRLLAELVAGRAVDRPVVRQTFVAGQDFFDHEIDRAAILRVEEIPSASAQRCCSFSKYSCGK